jgi:hypothetical protein
MDEITVHIILVLKRKGYLALEYEWLCIKWLLCSSYRLQEY